MPQERLDVPVSDFCEERLCALTLALALVMPPSSVPLLLLLALSILLVLVLGLPPPIVVSIFVVIVHVDFAAQPSVLEKTPPPPPPRIPALDAEQHSHAAAPDQRPYAAVSGGGYVQQAEVGVAVSGGGGGEVR